MKSCYEDAVTSEGGVIDLIGSTGAGGGGGGGLLFRCRG